MLAPLTGHGSSASVAIESVSYRLVYPSESSVPPSLLKVSHAIALRAAAEGVSLLYDSGDEPGVDTPASDPDVTAVGGTTLGIGAHSQRLFETGWSTAFGERTGNSGPWHDEGILLAAGGGASDVYGEPGYQKGVVPSSMARNKAGQAGRTVPDISADADPYSGMLFGLIVVHPNRKTTPYDAVPPGRDEHVHAADRRNRRRRRAGPAGKLRVPQPAAVLAGRKPGVPRHPAGQPVRSPGRPRASTQRARPTSATSSHPASWSASTTSRTKAAPTR